MRRILGLIVLFGLAPSFGCLTADDKRQWQEAVGELNRDNIKTIAPLSKSSSSSPSSP